MKILTWIKSLLKKKDKYAEWRIKIIHLVNGIKKIVESDVANAAVRLTPWTFDDAILAALRKWTPLILFKLGLSQEKLIPLTSLEQAASFLRIVSKEERGPLYAQLAGRYYMVATGIKDEQAAIDKMQQEYRTTIG